jgi:DNA-binding IclR family transcriptional regulator
MYSPSCECDDCKLIRELQRDQTFTAQLHDPDNTHRAISAVIRGGTGPDDIDEPGARVIAAAIADATGYVLADFYRTIS